jgi:hypothetical protein
VNWRKTFGIHTIDMMRLLPLFEKQIAYVNGVDKYGRALLYFKIGNIDTKVTHEDMIQILMYSVERADHYSTNNGSGEFVAVIDLKSMSFRFSPSFSTIKTALDLLKYNYPYRYCTYIMTGTKHNYYLFIYLMYCRLNSLILLNTGTLFTTLWSLVKPIMPPRALAKTFVLSKQEMNTVLIERIGKEYLETQYGGDVGAPTDPIDYVQQGYWYFHSKNNQVIEEPTLESFSLEEKQLHEDL